MIIRLYKVFMQYRFIKQHLKIGKDTKILTSFLNFGSEPYLIEIGDNCLITSGVKFLTHDGSVAILFKKYKNINLSEVYGKYNKLGRIKIGNNVFIGINSIIMPNVNIGDNVIIGAGSVVTKNIPSNYVYAGNPAREICKIEDLMNEVLVKSIRIEVTDKYERMKYILNLFEEQLLNED